MQQPQQHVNQASAHTGPVYQLTYECKLVTKSTHKLACLLMCVRVEHHKCKLYTLFFYIDDFLIRPSFDPFVLFWHDLIACPISVS